MKPEILQEQIDKQIEQMKEKIVNAKLSAELNELKVMLLGKKGKITEMMKIMKDLPSEDRPEFGKRMNMLRGIISSAIEKREEELK